MKCLACGHVVQRSSKFCKHCGKAVAPRVRSAPPPAASPRWPLFLALIAGGVLVGAVVMRLMQPAAPPEPAHAHNHFEGTLRGAALAAQYPQVYQVASAFICPCGTCTDGLEVCDCEMVKGAAEVRTKIFELLQVHEVPHAIALIAAEYGHRKNDPASSLNLPAPAAALPWAKPN